MSVFSYAACKASTIYKASSMIYQGLRIFEESKKLGAWGRLRGRYQREVAIAWASWMSDIIGGV